ncbi:hypothetical protein SEA_EYRE_38 [Gordonia phage Eyre]|uniref:Uncharacterized protein n=1 Tax=Gordonia phage Eyre TaxID=1887646 RepID=A0A1B3B011_9CAUD|nr:hypothetical protein BIZ73_gp38 [Gordonia phage Eyre]AOE44318.1 hypothetical protein SEA_EYRE_38 [Gordonia phage Eyre]
MLQSISENLGLGFVLATTIGSVFVAAAADDEDFEPMLVDRGVIVGAYR